MVTTLSLTVLVAVAASVGAQPAVDDNPDYSHPMWIYANPAALVESGIHVDDGFDQPGEYPGRFPQPHWTDSQLERG